MALKKYSMSFTTGALLKRESLIIAELYAQMGSWDKVREVFFDNNVLQTRTIATAKKLWREISSRLMQLTKEEITLLLASSPQEQGYLLWLAICRRYAFIGDFAVEVVRERFLSLQHSLTHEQYDIFFNSKADWHDEPGKIAPSTKTKLRSNLFKMLKEADLLDGENMIIPAMLTPIIITTLMKHSPAELAVFPMMETYLKEHGK